MIIPSLTHSLTELRPSWEAADCAATQELPADSTKLHYGTRAARGPAVSTPGIEISESWSRSSVKESGGGLFEILSQKMSASPIIIIKVIKSKSMGFVSCVARMGEMRREWVISCRKPYVD
jgi:hypothetical protein